MLTLVLIGVATTTTATITQPIATTTMRLTATTISGFRLSSNIIRDYIFYGIYTVKY